MAEYICDDCKQKWEQDIRHEGQLLRCIRCIDPKCNGFARLKNPVDECRITDQDRFVNDWLIEKLSRPMKERRRVLNTGDISDEELSRLWELT